MFIVSHERGVYWLATVAVTYCHTDLNIVFRLLTFVDLCSHEHCTNMT